METYLRLMFLKFRYRLGYESLCREVSDSITWRQFCRIGIDQPVPHPTTLMKLTTRCGSTAVDGLNEALLAKAVEAKVLRTAEDQGRHHRRPGQRRLSDRLRAAGQGDQPDRETGRRIHAAGGAARTKLRDRSRAAGRKAHDLNAKLRTRNAAAKDEALAVVQRKNRRARRPGRDRRRRGRTAPGQRETSHPDSHGGKPPTSPARASRTPPRGGGGAGWSGP